MLRYVNVRCLFPLHITSSLNIGKNSDSCVTSEQGGHLESSPAALQYTELGQSFRPGKPKALVAMIQDGWVSRMSPSCQLKWERFFPWLLFNWAKTADYLFITDARLINADERHTVLFLSSPLNYFLWSAFTYFSLANGQLFFSG